MKHKVILRTGHDINFESLDGFDLVKEFKDYKDVATKQPHATFSSEKMIICMADIVAILVVE